MARYTGAVCRLCRREGQKLFLKGAKCYSEHCPVAARNSLPASMVRAVKKFLSTACSSEQNRLQNVITAFWRVSSDIILKLPRENPA